MALVLTFQQMVFGEVAVRKPSYIDVKVFNPHAPSNCTINSKAIYIKYELCKKRSYEARICEVEQSSFTPLIFSATEGMAAEATVFYKHLASLLSDKWDSNYAAVMGGCGVVCPSHFCGQQ